MNTNKVILHNSSLKTTPSRLAVLGFLQESAKPLDADEIFKHITEEHEGADRATIYRILDAFTEKGIVTKLEFGEGKYRYEIAGLDHHHLICENCGSIEDISDCGIQEWEEEIQKKKGFMVKRHSLEFFGLCSVCQKEKN